MQRSLNRESDGESTVLTAILFQSIAVWAEIFVLLVRALEAPDPLITMRPTQAIARVESTGS